MGHVSYFNELTSDAISRIERKASSLYLYQARCENKIPLGKA